MEVFRLDKEIDKEKLDLELAIGKIKKEKCWVKLWYKY